MALPKLVQLGESAKLFHLSVSSVRYYEKLGLLHPEYTDPETGYRYYSPRQFEAFNTIRYLRALDMPLSEIADFLQNREVGRIEEKLRQQKDAVARKQAELRRIEHKIDNRLRQLYNAQTTELNRIQLLHCPSCKLFWVETPLTITSPLDMEEPTIKLAEAQAEALIFLGKVGISIDAEQLQSHHFTQYDGIFLVLDDEDHFDGQVMQLPENLCVSVRFCGSHAEAPEQYHALLDYIQTHRLTITGFSREITIIDYGITNDPDQFVTEITIPVAPCGH